MCPTLVSWNYFGNKRVLSNFMYPIRKMCKLVKMFRLAECLGLYSRAVMSRAFFGLKEIPSVIRHEQLVKADVVLIPTVAGSELSYRQQAHVCTL